MVLFSFYGYSIISGIIGCSIGISGGIICCCIIAICSIYTLLLVVELFLLRHVIRKGPAILHTGRYSGEQPELARIA